VYPLLVIATSAACVASQALISGAFSLTQQAIQLGYSPRMRIIHTSKHEAGQIYIPEVNKALAAGTLLLVLGFRSATRLGAAYGVAVSGTMAITSILFYMVVRHQWGWSKLKAGSFLVFFLTIDLSFFLANLAKVPHGGWVPLAVALFVFTLMTTWKRGRAILRAILQRGTVPIDMFLADVERRKPVRVKGTAVFMTSDPEGAPVVLLHHLKHNKVLHDQVILLSVVTAEVPEVAPSERIELESLGQGFFRVQASYGFMETPSVPSVLQFCGRNGINAKKTDVSYYLGRERLLPNLPRRSKDPEIGSMARWRKKLFVLMSQNARGATEFFGIPPNRVVELGTQIEF
jgi:KUP system potassium uptake protein